MNRILGIGYGFRKDMLDSFLKRVGLKLPGNIGQEARLSPDERWCLLKSRKDLHRASQTLTPNPKLQRAFINLAEPVLLVNIKLAYRKMPDFTFYVPCNPAKDEVEETLRHYQQAGKGSYSYECKLRIWSKNANWFAEGRVLACRCYEGKFWSLTLRKEKDSVGGKPAENFLNKPKQIIALLSELIFGERNQEKQIIKDKRGLIVVAGRTGVAKSMIARGLIEDYMNVKRPTGRTPHLLTYEDPIEKYMSLDEEMHNYTPRQPGKDVKDIDQAIKDALRQTPRIMFVGETREPGQWKQLLHFAATGHLVITTTHAGSLTETVGNILQAADAREPRARSIIADRLLAVIHLRAETARDTSFVLPALWLRTPIGAKALMAEGLSSLLPNTPVELDQARQRRASDFPPISIGRFWFARELVNAAKKTKQIASRPSPEVKEEVLRYGLKWDLEGI